MRRSDREVKKFDEIIKIMEKCDVCRLAMMDEEIPYILPLNFGMQVLGDTVTLYFHGARQGKKLELLAKNNKVSFEMDCSHRLVTDVAAGSCTMEFESVIGRGLIETVDNENEKYDALCILMAQYVKSEEFPFDRAIMPATTVLKCTVQQMTGKRRMKAEDKQHG
jgi:nitroimidazol reductase NimA-like FMN-containing flavoprotein (pyridoxamine 5'-phosphate oxidase superfamily)